MDDFTDFYTEYNGSDPDPSDSGPLVFEEPGLGALLWVALTLYALVFVVGVLGNGAVVWVVGFQMRRTVNTTWFLNLAVADLLCCLALPFLAAPLASDHRWALGDFACKLFPSLTILNMFASINLLVLISIDRCCLVLRPIWCQNHRSVRLAWGSCALAWLLALALTAPTFFSRSTYTYYDKSTCRTSYAAFPGDPRVTEVSVASTRFALAFALPLAVICVCYGLLLHRVRSSRFGQRSQKTLKVVLVVVVSFFVCWGPYQVAGLILASEPADSPLARSVNKADPLIVSLAYVNSCINPVIYVLAGHDFQSKVRRSVKALLRNVFSEESTFGRSFADGHAGTQDTCAAATTEDRSDPSDRSASTAV
ncbi:C5a anaphylatoxin chemotactic receptor 1 [Zootoca vivipara]|uniref:C5a anaphylatoxin chemotactic receptor 1 n=1 Tax=Zootoca vivipara TaxID=8524 RepID=UPI001591E409|nr:C5a anaphylatoxin chemotactic receptor 1 [Zootoca vivipara]XP_034974424.1 C5a anaphylatoxin chemotactic receptor 1 [Zootoca vivipara]